MDLLCYVWYNCFNKIQLDDISNGVDSAYETSAIIRDRETGEILSHFGEGGAYESTDLENWSCGSGI